MKTFSTPSYRHLCPKRESCFSCRRFYINSNTYYNTNLIKDFCNRFITQETSFQCPKCNLTIFSKHCADGHKKLCYGKGHFGWKCSKCNKFFYRYSAQTSAIIEKNHKCGMLKKCRVCFEAKSSPEHICAIKKPQYPKTWPLLGFITLELLENSPFLLIIYVQCKNNLTFKKFVYSDVPEVLCNEKTEDRFFSYYPKNFNVNYEEPKNRKVKQDFKENLKKLLKKNPHNSMKIRLLQTLMTRENITYICQDESSTTMVHTALFFLRYHTISLVALSFFNYQCWDLNR